MILAPLVLLTASCASASAFRFPPAPNSPVEGPKELEVLALPLAWNSLSPNVFDQRWILPEVRTSGGRDLLGEMRDLLTLRFNVKHPNGHRYQCLGDLVSAAQDLTPEARGRWYSELKGCAPTQPNDWDRALRELLFDSHLHSASWKPSEERERDGLLFAENWNMKIEGPPWNKLGVAPLMEQSAALLRADLASIKAVENDYRAYPNYVEADYEEIFPIDGSFFVGEDPAGLTYSALAIQFRCDLPFPFSSYTTRLRILNRFDADRVLSTHIYSTSEDFYWLAGRDVFLPVETSEGKWVAFLLVRHFGFDLDGVPDDSDNRREALRGSLGNLKRYSERLFSKESAMLSSPRNGPEILAKVRVLGQR